jgi:thioredoxin reductase
MNKKIDYIIVGGGIAGLYCAYKLLSNNHNAKLLVLEKQRKKYAGGRAGVAKFAGTDVVTGAGVGRKRKDKLLIKLMKELGIQYSEFKATHNYAQTLGDTCSVKETFLEIKRAYHDGCRGQTFKQFAISIIGEERYSQFIICSGYTDYENEDARSTIFDYGFDDNYENWVALSIPWDKLIHALIDKIGHDRVKFSSGVNKIDLLTDGFKVFTEKNVFYCDKVFVAGTIDTVTKLVPGASDKNSIYRQIRGQPFLRTYGKFSASSLPIMRELVPSFTVVPGPIQKIIPMNPEKGVYMICYSDNNAAEKMNIISEDDEQNRERFCRILEKSLGAPKDSLKLLEIKDFYWRVGTHYYCPLPDKYKTRREFIKAAQRPFPNMYVIGEMISTNQGWVEGALESVETLC